MSKKKKDAAVEEEVFTDEDEIEIETEVLEDFDVEEEYKPIPLIPKGRYPGDIIAVEIIASAIVFTIEFADPEEDFALTDGSLLHGCTEVYKIWLPKIGDRELKTASGKQTKHQWKVNNLKKMSEKLEMNLNSVSAIKESIESTEWLGISVIADVAIKTYKGNTSNEITDLVLG